MTAQWTLGEEWASAGASFSALLPVLQSGRCGTVSLTVSAGPRREATLRWTYEDGKPSGAPSDAALEPDLVLTMAADAAREVFAGEVSPSVAFMRGRLKAAGSGGLLLEFLKSTSEPGFDEWRRSVGGLATGTSGSPPRHSFPG